MPAVPIFCHLNRLKEARFEGVRLQPMAPDGYDLFVGGKFDRSFGPVLFFGLGGIYIELFRDVACTLCPADEPTVHQQLQKLKAYQLLKGTRGQAPGDLPALVELVARVSRLLADFPSIREIDLNPVRVFAEGGGVLVLDARARIE